MLQKSLPIVIFESPGCGEDSLGGVVVCTAATSTSVTLQNMPTLGSELQKQKNISEDIQVPSKKKNHETLNLDRYILPTCPMGLGLLEIQTASSATPPTQSGDIYHSTASVNMD